MVLYFADSMLTTFRRHGSSTSIHPTKVQVCPAPVISVLLYAVETWTAFVSDIKTILHKVQTAKTDNASPERCRSKWQQFVLNYKQEDDCDDRSYIDIEHHLSRS